MGANQSSGAGSGPAEEEVKTSYYELLGIERSATEDEIKKAYRRKALELHPDRNYGDVERTTKLFAEVQVAYEVLSDPQERAWYDSHEGQILRGDAGGAEDHFEHNMRVTTADDIMKMLRHFHGGIQYTDSPTGFFGFLRETFDTLAKEELAAADWEGVEVIDYPSFGHKDDTYEDVVRDFYSAWSGFATKKTFAWKDKYRYSEAPDRRVRRLMEKENKKLRDEAIREFNEAVRTLILFVRRRDPRYTPNTQTEEERSAAQRAAAAAQAARSKAAHAAKLQEAVPEWVTARDPEEEEEEEEEEIEEEHFECVACHKTFKSEKQYDAHEKSKKHQKAVQALKRRMQKENKHLNLDKEVSSSADITPMSADEDQDGLEEFEGQNGRSRSVDEEITDGVKNLHVPSEDEEDDEKDKLENDKQGDGKQIAPVDLSPSDEEEDDEYASRTEVEARIAGITSSLGTSGLGTETPQTEDSSASAAPSAPKMGKAAQKRAKKAAKMADASQSEYDHKCAGCNTEFPSKNKLFQHIKDNPDHVAPIYVTKGGKAAGGKKGKKR